MFVLYTPSLSYILKEMIESEHSSFEIRMELKNAQIKFWPDIEIEAEQNFLGYIICLTDYVENIIYSVPRIVHLESTCRVSLSR